MQLVAESQQRRKQQEAGGIYLTYSGNDIEDCTHLSMISMGTVVMGERATDRRMRK